ncbi:hypothetical protein Q4S45_00245 [Massilia sp. R2A-15]|uniref:hypothetical protein n=1 Tax=Massilia sp. R2A-15 TaxID=3064278 RepID=UPI0027361120|nr:hypothetical protein [Massilia sp. R2A-15]WLI89599.1 hypothetical protein Q4S45_00245 [Massilia sp. R2A-15]
MYVAISQDGAGCSNYNDGVDGFYTNKVESCIVYIFYGTEGWGLLHDTAQLSLASIAQFAKGLGKIRRIYYALNDAIIRAPEIKNHAERRRKIARMISYKADLVAVSMPLGELVCFPDESILSSFKDRDEIAKIRQIAVSCPVSKERAMVNILNNLFIAKDAQNIPVDVQFRSRQFQALPQLLSSKEQMLDRSERELARGDPDYANNLKIAIKMGVVAP